MKQIIDSQIVEQAEQLIQQSERIVIITHISPDGDAMGSSLAMKWYLQQRDKQAQVIIPNAYPDFLAWIPGVTDALIYEKNVEQGTALLEQANLIIITDFQEAKRAGDAIGAWLLANQAKEERTPVIMIDHHLHPSDLADITISHPECPSASELVYRFIHQLDPSFHQSINSHESGASIHQFSTCVYTGMMTDTGNFQYNSNNPEMYEIVADLMRAGVDKDECYNKVFNQFHTGRMRLVGYCLYRKMRIFPKKHVALIALSSEELKQFNFQSGDAEGIVNMPLQISKVYYSCFMREDTDKIKLSFRSQGDRPINHFAQDIYNGGGHKNAAGGEYYGSLKDAVRLFLENYEKYCE